MKKGFTLIELLVVIVMLGIMGVVFIPMIAGYVENDEIQEGNAEIITQEEEIKIEAPKVRIKGYIEAPEEPIEEEDIEDNEPINDTFEFETQGRY